MDKTKLNIGAYYLKPYAQTEKHVKEVKECGIDFIVDLDYNLETLDWFEKYNLGAIVQDIIPRWVGGNGANAGTMKTQYPLTMYEAGAKNYQNHPAIWAVDICDDPSAVEFPYLSEVLEKTEKLFPKQWRYINLYPNYAQVAVNSSEQTISQLGTATYEEHIEKYCQQIPLDYICYDFYMYSINVALAYENLRIVSKACLETGREMWIVLQVNSLYPEIWISENQLRFQAYSAMAFGARNIIWACYTKGWWNNQVLDEQGNKTQQYAKLQKVNFELKRIGDEYSKYRRAATHFLGFTNDDEDLAEIKQAPISRLDTGVFTDVHTDGKFLVGQMSNIEKGEYALMVVAADNWSGDVPKTNKLYFKANGRKVTVFSGKGEIPLEKENGYYVLELTSCEGALITAK